MNCDLFCKILKPTPQGVYGSSVKSGKHSSSLLARPNAKAHRVVRAKMSDAAGNTDSVSPEKVMAIQSLFQDLPTGFSARHEAIGSIRDAFHIELAHAMEDALNRHLEGMLHDSVDEKRATASYVNEVLRSVGLAIKSKEPLSRPATLVADVKPDSSEVGQHAVYRLHHRGNDGRAVRTTLGRGALPRLSLVPDKPWEAFWSRKRESRDSMTR